MPAAIRHIPGRDRAAFMAGQSNSSKEASPANTNVHITTVNEP